MAETDNDKTVDVQDTIDGTSEAEEIFDEDDIHLNLDRDTMQGRLGDYARLGSDARLSNDRVPMLRKVFNDWVLMLSALVPIQI
jgi:hypothetical protein